MAAKTSSHVILSVSHRGIYLSLLRTLVDWGLCEHDPHLVAWHEGSPRGCQCGDLDSNWARSSRFHVRIVVLAERKAHSELRVELSEFLQADELVFTACSGADVERYAKLVMR